MKNLLFLVCFSFCLNSFGQQQFIKDSVINFQKQINKEYADKKESPLLPEDFEHFKSLDFYPISSKFYVIAKFVRTADEKPFEMPTSGKRKPMYVKYGEAYFELEGKSCKLNLYRNIELSKQSAFKDYLFLPFTDLTSGVDTYGGGRYIDLKVPQGNTIALDFNKAYNPYCAYSHKYSCPIPPAENNLKVAVTAGVKKFHD